MKIAKKPKYAIVNSIVSARCIQPLRASGIPVITLIHEFSAYIRPTSIINEVARWSDTIIFSSKLTRDDLASAIDLKYLSKVNLLPQGKCNNPPSCDERTIKDTHDEGTAYLKALDESDILILGAGQIQQRKGVDLFIEVANQINKRCQKRIKFLWIGSGYKPHDDFNVSLWLNDQINRCNLQEKISIVDNTSSYLELMERADLFLMTSRLDPLPNVCIDAMYTATPTLGFKMACGIASLVSQDKQLKNALVAEYLNTTNMADKAIELIKNSEYRLVTGKKLIGYAVTWFVMVEYMKELDRIGCELSSKEKIMQRKQIIINK